MTNSNEKVGDSHTTRAVDLKVYSKHSNLCNIITELEVTVTGKSFPIQSRILFIAKNYELFWCHETCCYPEKRITCGER